MLMTFSPELLLKSKQPISGLNSTKKKLACRSGEAVPQQLWPEELREKERLTIISDPHLGNKALGVYSDVESDSMYLSVPSVECNQSLTKKWIAFSFRTSWGSSLLQW